MSGRLTLSIRTLIWCLWIGAGVLLATLLLILGLGRDKGLPGVTIDYDAQRQLALQRLLTQGGLFRSLIWTVNQPAPQDRRAVAFLVVASTSRQGGTPSRPSDTVNAAYDRRSDALFVTSGFVQLLVDFPENERIRNFASLIILHELGHRDSARHGGPLPDPVDEERRADAYAVGHYMASGQKDLSALVEDIWNIAEGEVLGIFTQYGPYDPVTDYTSHGGFMARMANLYKAILATPGLSAEDAEFVSRLAAQMDRFAANARSVRTLVSLPPGRIAAHAVDCGTMLRVIDTMGGSHGVQIDALRVGNARSQTRITLDQPHRIANQSDEPLQLRSVACDETGHLLGIATDGALYIEEKTTDRSLLMRKLHAGDRPEDWTISGNNVTLASVDDGAAKLTSVASNRAAGAEVTTTMLTPPKCVEACVLEGVRLQAGMVVYLFRLPDGTLKVQPQMSGGIQLAPGAGVTVGHGPGEIAEVERSSNGFRSRLSDTQTWTKVPSVGLSESSVNPSDLRITSAFERSACYGLALPGRFVALLDPTMSQPRFLDSYMSAAEVLVALGGRDFLVSIPYSRFLVVAHC